MKEDMIHFHTLEDLQVALEKDLQELKKKSEEYSTLIGEKLRAENAGSNPAEMAELKEKLEGSTDPKKKKLVKKKDQKTSWHDIGAILVYDGIGAKGELELYFQTLEKLKSKIEKLEKIKESVDGLVSKGIKKELGCVALFNHDAPLQIAFIKSDEPKAKFSYKSIFTLPVEHIHEIKI